MLFNVLLGIFNFLPVPPLDGSTLLYRVLTPRQAWQIRPFLTQYGIFLVLAVVLLLSRPLGNAHLRRDQCPGGRVRPASSNGT